MEEVLGLLDRQVEVVGVVRHHGLQEVGESRVLGQRSESPGVDFVRVHGGSGGRPSPEAQRSELLRRQAGEDEMRPCGGRRTL